MNLDHLSGESYGLSFAFEEACAIWIVDDLPQVSELGPELIVLGFQTILKTFKEGYYEPFLFSSRWQFVALSSADQPL